MHLLLFLLASCLAQPLAAQEEAPPPPPPVRPGGFDVIAGIAGVVGLPQGAFGDHVDTAYGGSGYVLVTRHHGAFGLRLQGDVLAYGSETVHVPRTGLPRFTTDVTTTNWIGSLALGPQLVARAGPIRPYLHATAGFSYFSTDSEARNVRTTNFDDYTFAYGAGAGVLIPLSHDLALDLGARYAGNQQVDYLTEGDIVEGARGVIGFTPRRSKANLWEFHLGVSFGL